MGAKEGQQEQEQEQEETDNTRRARVREGKRAAQHGVFCSSFFLETLPNPLLTRDQINLLHYDSVSTKGIANLRKIVKNPISMETVVKNYL